MSKSQPVIIPPRDLSHFVVDTSRAGEIVRIVDHNGVLEPGTFEIRNHETNTRTGRSWFNLFGGDADRMGHRGNRSVTSDRIRPARKREQDRHNPAAARAGETALADHETCIGGLLKDLTGHEDCDRPKYSSGLCTLHYSRQRTLSKKEK